MKTIMLVLAALVVLGSQAVFAADTLSLAVREVDDHLVVRFTAVKDAAEPICAKTDQIYLWNENEFGYRYYMIGKGEGSRENIWAGVGHAENTGLDYLVISVRNLGLRFGEFFPQNLVRAFTLNGRFDPGTVEDGGLDIYPIRTVRLPELPGLDNLTASSSYYEMNNNDFILRFNFRNDVYDLGSFEARNIAVHGDGDISVKLKRH